MINKQINQYIKRKSLMGFTLIELLIVIAIIGVLSTIILAGLNNARNRAKDASIKQAVAQLQNLRIMNYSEYESYCQLSHLWITQDGITCDTVFSGNYATQARAICNDIYDEASNWAGNYRIYSNVGGGYNCSTDYSIMVALNNGKWYCSGSSGRKGEYTSYSVQPGCYNNP